MHKLVWVETVRTVVLGIICFLGVRFVANFDDQFMMLRAEISNLATEMKTTNNTLVEVTTTQKYMIKRMDDHEDRIKKVEGIRND